MPYPANIREEELKNKVEIGFFAKYGCAEIIKNIDFAVKSKKSEEYLLWAEAKAAPSDILVMLAQLVLTKVAPSNRESKGSFYTPKIEMVGLRGAL